MQLKNKKKILVIGHVWPEPNTTAAGERILQLIQLFQAENHQVVFVSAASETKHSANLTELGIQTSFINLNDPAFDRLISELEPDIVIFDRFMVEEQFGWRVTENCPEAIRILNTEDLHSLREYRETCFKKDQTFSAPAWLQQDKTKREIASIYRSDLTLLTSSFEEKILLEALKIASELLLHLPFMYALPEKQTITGWPTFSERVDFVTYGNGKHTPNIDSFEYLKTTIWPLIRKALPEAKLHVYGAYFSQHLIQMNDPSNGFLVHGWEQDLASAVQSARVLLAPLRFGAGIKGKLTFAMGHGTPSVTTAIGAEGMHADFPWAGEIEDTPELFSQKAIALYQDEQQWRQQQQNGLIILKSIYSREQGTKRFMDKLLLIRNSLKAHRAGNFIGALLRHQTMAATKYMGKWIAEKNKNS